MAKKEKNWIFNLPKDVLLKSHKNGDRNKNAGTNSQRLFLGFFEFIHLCDDTLSVFSKCSYAQAQDTFPIQSFPSIAVTDEWVQAANKKWALNWFLMALTKNRLFSFLPLCFWCVWWKTLQIPNIFNRSISTTFYSSCWCDRMCHSSTVLWWNSSFQLHTFQKKNYYFKNIWRYISTYTLYEIMNDNKT